MPGEETGGVTNFWYSFDYGLAHFISFTSETDYPYSPSNPFVKDTNGKNPLSIHPSLLPYSPSHNPQLCRLNLLISRISHVKNLDNTPTVSYIC